MFRNVLEKLFRMRQLKKKEWCFGEKRKKKPAGRRLIDARISMSTSRRTREIFTRVMDVGSFKFIFHGRLLLTVSVCAAAGSFNLIEFAPETRRFEVNDRGDLADEMSDML